MFTSPIVPLAYVTFASMYARLAIRHDLVNTFERSLVRFFAFGVARQLGLGVVGVVVVVLVLSPAIRKRAGAAIGRHRP